MLRVAVNNFKILKIRRYSSLCELCVKSKKCTGMCQDNIGDDTTVGPGFDLDGNLEIGLKTSIPGINKINIVDVNDFFPKSSSDDSSGED
jgi:hypothetical protein